jgi:hypothetical protein
MRQFGALPIGDSRIAGLTEDSVTFRWKDRANGGTPRTATLPGVEFSGYLQHVLPRDMKAIRYGFCHPAAVRSGNTLPTGCAPCPARRKANGSGPVLAADRRYPRSSPHGIALAPSAPPAVATAAITGLMHLKRDFS